MYTINDLFLYQERAGLYQERSFIIAVKSVVGTGSVSCSDGSHVRRASCRLGGQRRVIYTIVTFLGLYQECAVLYQERSLKIAAEPVVGTG